MVVGRQEREGTLKSAEIREQFLKFFEEKGCRCVASSSLVPDDPSLLLTNAGMNQFKQYYLGKKTMAEIGACSCQKCLRTNDIDAIGKDGRHLSFFEMLGNFSFGGYTKQQACAWAFEFITSDKYLGLPLDRLYFTVFTDDDEAHDIWRELGVAEDHISRLGEDDNFWAAGPTGPCGPCSEIYYDQGPEVGCGSPDCKPGCDCDRYLEFWNLVFTQYDRQEDGSLPDLPHRNIDTGMGLERISAIMQGKSSNYESDVLRGLIALGERKTGVAYGAAAKSDVSLRILADHSRAVTFMIGDGILPSNEGRGYVLRRLLRRAIYHGRMLGIEGAFMGEYVDAVIAEMGHAYPEIVENADLIRRICASEEERFSATLRTGQAYLEEALAGLAQGEALGGEDAFKLHDTYGFPFDLTVEVAQAAGHEVDHEGFEREMQAQRERARSQVKDVAWSKFDTVWVALSDKFGADEFVGYDQDSIDTQIRALVRDEQTVDEATAGEKVDVLLPPHAVLRREGRPGGRRRRHRGRRLQAPGERHHLRREDPLGAPLHRAHGHRPRGRRLHGHRRPYAPRAHPPQPHGHPHPARRAAPGPGHARQPGRLARGAGAPALRLHPLPAAHPRRARADRAPVQRAHHGRPAGEHPRVRHRRGPRLRRHGAVRREVR